MVEGIRGFIPASRLSLSYIEDLESYLLKDIEVQVIDVDQANNRLVLSARELLKEKEKKEKPKRPGGTKNLEKEVAAAERAVAKAEERMFDLTQEMEAAAADYLKLQDLYEQKEALEEEILKLYGKWEDLSAQLEEARG